MTTMNEHSAKFEHIKQMHEDKQWDKNWVRNSVAKGWITPAEYEEITKEPYPEPNK